MNTTIKNAIQTGILLIALVPFIVSCGGNSSTLTPEPDELLYIDYINDTIGPDGEDRDTGCTAESDGEAEEEEGVPDEEAVTDAEEDTSNTTIGELNESLTDEIADTADEAHQDLLELADTVSTAGAMETSNVGGDSLDPCDADCSLLALPNVSSLECRGGRCRVSACDANYYDRNTIDADGCECLYTGRELCDGIDNDCNGEIDEGYDIGQACNDDDGAAGTIICSMDHMESICNTVPPAIQAPIPASDEEDASDEENGEPAIASAPEAAVDAEEAADNSQPNEDNTPDAGNPSDAEEIDCSTQVLPNVNSFSARDGQCRIGACDANYLDTDGIYSNGCECQMSGSELCDGYDNDCDGKIDEGFNVGGVCTKETGRGDDTGVTVCTPDRKTTRCE